MWLESGLLIIYFIFCLKEIDIPDSGGEVCAPKSDPLDQGAGLVNINKEVILNLKNCSFCKELWKDCLYISSISKLIKSFGNFVILTVLTLSNFLNFFWRMKMLKVTWWWLIFSWFGWMISFCVPREKKTLVDSIVCEKLKFFI